MLALTRKQGESIIIGHDIEITVVEVQGDRVKLGIAAPRQVPIYRKEIYLEIEQANKDAIKTSKTSLESVKSLLKTDKNKINVKKG